jgi:xanthine dehydrogenase small subunit
MEPSIRFLLNDSAVETDAPAGMAVLDYLRDLQGLTGTKHACREGDCGACSVLVGDLDEGGELTYRAVTSCLLPVGELAGRHLVTVEGLSADALGPVHRAIVDEGASQCGFCTPGFVVAITEHLLHTLSFDLHDALIAVAGNLCRCTGYASIRRAIQRVLDELRGSSAPGTDRINTLIDVGVLPDYFATVRTELVALAAEAAPVERGAERPLVAGGTDLYVQRLEEIEGQAPRFLMREMPSRIWIEAGQVRLSATTTAEDLKESPLLRGVLGDIAPFVDLICSQPIRRRATVAGNIVNASPIGDMTIMLLALGAELRLVGGEGDRTLALREFFLGYKELDLLPGEIIESIAFPESHRDGLFNFEKVCKREYLDIASVNSACCLHLDGDRIAEALLSAGGVAPIPMRLARTEDFLVGRPASAAVAREAADIARSEISPISDVRGSAPYKALLLGQLVLAHFHVLLGLEAELVSGAVG